MPNNDFTARFTAYKKTVLKGVAEFNKVDKQIAALMTQRKKMIEKFGEYLEEGDNLIDEFAEATGLRRTYIFRELRIDDTWGDTSLFKVAESMDEDFDSAAEEYHDDIEETMEDMDEYFTDKLDALIKFSKTVKYK